MLADRGGGGEPNIRLLLPAADETSAGLRSPTFPLWRRRLTGFASTYRLAVAMTALAKQG